jgi:hypothetical protein
LPAISRETWVERHSNTARLRTLYPRVEELAERLATLEKGSKPE